MSDDWKQRVMASVEGEAPVDLSELLEKLLKARKLPVVRHEGALLVHRLGLSIRPRALSAARSDDGVVRTVSAIVWIDRQVFPRGTFEYQHGRGRTLREALELGLNDWLALDLPVLLDAKEDTPRTCPVMKLSFPDGRVRRVLLGPAKHQAEQATAAQRANDPHPFCSCCFVTQSLPALDALLKSDEPYAVRFVALRMSNGEVSVDCRVNGEDFAPGHGALVHYAGSWPQLGFEARKQYVIIQSDPPPRV